MKKVIEIMRLNGIVNLVKQWKRRNRKKDDDMFDHPFAIF